MLFIKNYLVISRAPQLTIKKKGKKKIEKKKTTATVTK